ncbi:hypothetical protein [Ramlibacter sp.]|uniref:hypothetical protein n=1 Tax=Ramlibacter sp. TaxID=1917967 RepID=UPI0017B574D6|nr:hypothetical protein [Ramlibacter sp.]MBA2674692.1 hypothetical protein [Ramlibacter sp.]
MKRLLLAAMLSAVCAAAFAQGSAPAASPACPAPAEVRQVHMLGTWRATFDGLPRGASMLFEKHPEYEESLTGFITRDAAKSQLAGDVDKGEFTMEESYDGTHISAVWTGDIVAGSCGREIRGTWQEEKDPPKPYPFVLRKMQGRR